MYCLFIVYAAFIWQLQAYKIVTVPFKATVITSFHETQLQNKLPTLSLFMFNQQRVPVGIESPTLNSRIITSNIIIDCPRQIVWSLLSDYDSLSNNIPNLVKSHRVPSSDGSIRIFQEGAQNIVGFNFRASLTMEMKETKDDSENNQWSIGFKLVNSQMFDAFDGAWTFKTYSRFPIPGSNSIPTLYHYRTKLSYSVYVRPKGLVPVFALEWRIKEDVPINLVAIKNTAEKVYAQQLKEQQNAASAALNSR